MVIHNCKYSKLSIRIYGWNTKLMHILCNLRSYKVYNYVVTHLCLRGYIKPLPGVTISAVVLRAGLPT